MKTVLSIVFCLLVSFSLSARSSENSASGKNSGSEFEAESPEHTLEVESAATEDNMDEKTDSEPDSSYYSVNKFNFLFYFVYKMKYMDGNTTEETPAN